MSTDTETRAEIEEGFAHGATALTRYLIELSARTDDPERLVPLDTKLVQGLVAFLLNREDAKREALERIVALDGPRVGSVEDRLACALRYAREGLESDSAEADDTP